ADDNATNNDTSPPGNILAGDQANNEPDQKKDEKPLPRNVHCPASSVAWQFSCTRQSPGEPTGSRVLRDAVARPLWVKSRPLYPRKRTFAHGIARPLRTKWTSAELNEAERGSYRQLRV